MAGAGQFQREIYLLVIVGFVLRADLVSYSLLIDGFEAVNANVGKRPNCVVQCQKIHSCRPVRVFVDHLAAEFPKAVLVNSRYS